MSTPTAPPAPVATVDAIRAAFPALQREHRGKPVAYFDGPGGTQVPAVVAGAVTDYLLHHNANSGWAYPTSVETDEALAAARHTLADLLGGHPTEMVFGANMTTLVQHVARGLGRRWGRGDEIIVTRLDHQAHVAPWRELAAERGVTIRSIPFDTTTGVLDEEAYFETVNPRTKLVALGLASNALGTITDVARLSSAARDVGALVSVDAVHAAPHVSLDVAALGADLVFCSAYKFHGPHVGMLWGREALLADIDVPRLPPASNGVPQRIETGTLNHEGIVGAAAAVDWLASLCPAEGSRRARLQAVFAGLHDRGMALVSQLWAGLGAIDGVRLYGPPPGMARTPTVAFTYGNVPSRRVAEQLAEQALFVSDGDFYASTVVEDLGLAGQGLVRIGCAATTTAEEIDRLVKAAARLV